MRKYYRGPKDTLISFVHSREYTRAFARKAEISDQIRKKIDDQRNGVHRA